MSELTKTCPNQDVLIDGLWTENVRIDRNVSKVTKICQLGRLDLDMFLSIPTLFPCTENHNESMQVKHDIFNQPCGT